jgi:CheY-like chemotaxis protein
MTTPSIGEAAMRLRLEELGYPRHKQVGVIESVTGLTRVAASRRLSGETAWDINEYADNCEKLGSNIFDVLGNLENQTMKRAELVLGEAKLPCMVKLGVKIKKGEKHRLVAIEKHLNWIVQEQERDNDKDEYVVEKINLILIDKPNVTTLQRVAVFDDDEDACDTLCDGLDAEGFLTKAYYSLDEYSAAIRSNAYDAFVLDWLTPSGTTEAALKEIRRHQPDATIALLTGKINDTTVQMDRLTSCLTKYDAKYFAKPTPIVLIAEALRRKPKS